MTRKGSKVVTLLVLASVVVAPGLAQGGGGHGVHGRRDEPWGDGGPVGRQRLVHQRVRERTRTPPGHLTTHAEAPGATPYDLTGGPDGDLWFTDNERKAVGYGRGRFTSSRRGWWSSRSRSLCEPTATSGFHSAGVTHSIVKMTPAGTFTGDRSCRRSARSPTTWFSAPTVGQEHLVLGHGDDFDRQDRPGRNDHRVPAGDGSDPDEHHGRP